MKVQTKAEVIGQWSCLAFCYLYCCNNWTTDGEALKKVSDLIDEGKILASDCTVLDPVSLIYRETGRRCIVKKVNINSIKDIKDKTPVNFKCGNYNHWVVVENGEIVFNSLDFSNCVKNGKPAEMREIKYI